ncbi:MAG: hypothetical protein JW902_13430 [Syntrophaceae bacterium]|nr:hypothetical protein [Syntrophaceae bacterium]
MIDVHCHILPGIDDGPATLEEALAMCRMAVADGIQSIVATPHCYHGKYPNDEASILPVYKDLRDRVREEGILLDLHVAGDVHIHPELPSFLKKNECLYLGGRFVLVEIPSDVVPRFIGEFLFNMRISGFIPVLTHPERNRTVQSNPQILDEWIAGGGLTQITAMSLTGDFGIEAKQTAFDLIDRGWVHCLATDAHSTGWRKPILSNALRSLIKYMGKEGANLLVKENPRRLISGYDPLPIFPRSREYGKSLKIHKLKKYIRLPGFLSSR